VYTASLAASTIGDLADRVLHMVEDSRATWRRSHVAAEAIRGTFGRLK